MFTNKIVVLMNHNAFLHNGYRVSPNPGTSDFITFLIWNLLYRKCDLY